MEQPKVSVVIPVYGVEKYIEQCARSLFEQTMQEGIEFIFIDDCSPDRSIEILEKVLKEYPHREPQVKIIQHSKNQGIGYTRNTGVEHSIGEYIIHCDSDDWVEADMYETLYRKATEGDADIVLCDSWWHERGKCSYYSQYFSDLTNRYLLEIISGVKFSPNGVTLPSFWNKLIKTACYDGCRFREEGNTWEDILMLMQILRSSPSMKIVHVNKAYYHYRADNSNSLTHSRLDFDVLSTDPRIIDMLHNILYDSSDIGLQQCYGAAVTLIVWRSFITSHCLFSNAEWMTRYGKYVSLTGCLNNNYKCIVKSLLIRLAGAGFYKYVFYMCRILKKIQICIKRLYLFFI